MKKPKPVSRIAYAPYGRRFVAFIIDWYCSSMFAMIPIVIAQSIQASDLKLVNRIDTLPFSTAVIVTIGALGMTILYFCVFPLVGGKTFGLGQTIGRKLMHLTLESSSSKKLTFSALFVREIIGVLLLQGILTSINIYFMSLAQMITQADVVPYFQSVYFLLAGASSVFLIFGRRKQTFHDLISHTRMIVHQETPLSPES